MCDDKRTVFGLTAFLVILFFVSTAQADPKELADGVIVEDFEDGKISAYRQTVFGGGEARSGVVRRKGNRILHLNQEARGWTKAFLEGRKFRDFTLEVDVKKPALLKGYAGVVFRDDMRVFFRQKGMVQMTASRPHRSIGESIHGFPITKFHRLKVVCVGPIVRIYVNGQVVLEANDKAFDREGPVALTSHSTSAYFDNLRIRPGVAPEEAVMMEPWAEDDALVFSPDKDVKLKLRAANFADVEQQIRYTARVRNWKDKALSKEHRGKLTVKAGERPMVSVSLGSFEEGYYKIVLRTECGKRDATTNVYPLAIHNREAVEWNKPVIPLAPYWKYKVTNRKPIIKKTYMHAAAHVLRKNNFNAIVAGVGIDKVQVDILKEYGLSVITRGMKCIDEPSVIAGLIGDEPKRDDIQNYKKKYDELRAKTDKPLTTCMIGESLLHALEYWEILEPDLRAFRWYGFKKSYYNLRRRLDYKNMISFVGTLVIASRNPTPYWVILPSFGKESVHGYYRDPLPSELQGMMHLCLAHEASGLLFFSFQPQSGRLESLVDAVSLEPMDDKLAAVAEVNKMVQDNAQLIRSLQKTGLAVRTDSHAVEIQGLDLPEQDAEEKASGGTVRNQYFYVINIDNTKMVNCHIFNIPPKADYTEVYSGEKFNARKETVELRPGSSYETGVFRLKLEPGEGKLFKMHQKWERPDPVAYPEWVEKVPQDKTVWLVDLPAKNKPQPGWLPKKPGSWRKKTWAEMNGKVTLYPELYNPLGIECPRSIYAQAETTIVYDIPEGCTKFVAAAGLGNRDDRSSVVFKVLVDGKAKYTSDTFHSGDGIIPVIVDVTGAEKMTLVTLPTDDGIGYDYAWWGDARLIKE